MRRSLTEAQSRWDIKGSDHTSQRSLRVATPSAMGGASPAMASSSSTRALVSRGRRAGGRGLQASASAPVLGAASGGWPPSGAARGEAASGEAARGSAAVEQEPVALAEEPAAAPWAPTLLQSEALSSQPASKIDRRPSALQAPAAASSRPLITGSWTQVHGW